MLSCRLLLGMGRAAPKLSQSEQTERERERVTAGECAECACVVSVVYVDRVARADQCSLWRCCEGKGGYSYAWADKGDGREPLTCWRVAKTGHGIQTGREHEHARTGTVSMRGAASLRTLHIQ